MNIIVKRKLKDYNAWKKVVSDANEVRKQYGSKGMTVYRSASDPNEVYLLIEWDNSKPYMNYFNRSDVQESLAATGTTEIIEVRESFSLEE